MSTRMDGVRIVVATICWLSITVSVWAQVPGSEHEPSREQQSGREMPDHRLVLRISDDFLNSLLEDEKIDRQVPVRENILGTDVHGQARVQAQPGIKLVETPDKATFYLTLQGTLNSRSTGYHGPAVIYSRAVTTFTASKKVVFEPGKGFVGATPVVNANTTTTVDGIASVPGGLIGRIVRRRASRQEAAQHNQVQEIARQRAEARIRAGFQRTSEARLAKLNSAPENTALASLFKPSGNGDLQYACCTTRDCLQIASFFANDAARGPIQLPFAENQPHAPIEVWMHESIVTPRMEAGMEVAKTAVNTVVPAKDRSHEKLITIHHVDDWRRVDVTAKPSQLMALASILPEKTELRAKPVIREKTGNARSTPRTWRSGKYSAEASFVALEGNLVRLHRTSGVDASIEFAKLSADDQNWIRRHMAMQ